MERRNHARQLSCIPASFDSDRATHAIAFIRDVSVSGARLFARARLEVGETVVLNLYLGEGVEPRQTRGRVVRVEQGNAAQTDIWTWDIGVEFDEPITAYADEIEALAKRQQEIGTLKR